MRSAFDVVCLQAAWWAAALGAVAGTWWPGTAACILAAAVQLALADDRPPLLQLIGLGAALGIGLESGLIASGLVNYAAAQPAVLLAPVWLVALWGAFATCLPMLRGALGRAAVVKAAVLGAVAAPPTYWAADRLGALTLTTPLSALCAIASAWAFAMAVLVAAAGRPSTAVSPRA